MNETPLNSLKDGCLEHRDPRCYILIRVRATSHTFPSPTYGKSCVWHQFGDQKSQGSVSSRLCPMNTDHDSTRDGVPWTNVIHIRHCLNTQNSRRQIVEIHP